MPSSSSPLAYDDCREAFDKALASKRGIRVGPFKNLGTARNFRQRLMNLRRLDRENNKKIYADQPDSFYFANSEYDRIVVSIPKDDNGVLMPYVELLPRRFENLGMQEL